MSSMYSADAPTREQVDALEGPTVLELGTNWCGYCKAAQPLIEDVLQAQAAVRHIKVEDGKGRRLGRTFGVKLWPTLIFLKDGQEITRVVRPGDAATIVEAVNRITA